VTCESDERPERKRRAGAQRGEAARACVPQRHCRAAWKARRRPVVFVRSFSERQLLAEACMCLAAARPSSRRSSLSRVHWTRSSAVAPLRQIASHSTPGDFRPLQAPPAFHERCRPPGILRCRTLILARKPSTGRFPPPSADAQDRLLPRPRGASSATALRGFKKATCGMHGS